MGGDWWTSDFGVDTWNDVELYEAKNISEVYINLLKYLISK